MATAEDSRGEQSSEWRGTVDSPPTQPPSLECCDSCRDSAPRCCLLASATPSASLPLQLARPERANHSLRCQRDRSLQTHYATSLGQPAPLDRLSGHAAHAQCSASTHSHPLLCPSARCRLAAQKPRVRSIHACPLRCCTTLRDCFHSPLSPHSRWLGWPSRQRLRLRLALWTAGLHKHCSRHRLHRCRPLARRVLL